MVPVLIGHPGIQHQIARINPSSAQNLLRQAFAPLSWRHLQTFHHVKHSVQGMFADLIILFRLKGIA